MHRNITAVYRSHATADLVRRELEELGIAPGDIHLIPDRANPVEAEGQRQDNWYSDQLHDLHLPEDDVRTYQQSLRRGDYVVSVEVDGEQYGQVGRVQTIMSRPEEEAHNLDQRSSEFEGADLEPYSDANSGRPGEDQLARRDPDHVDPYTRSYVRKARLDSRR